MSSVSQPLRKCIFLDEEKAQQRKKIDDEEIPFKSIFNIYEPTF